MTWQMNPAAMAQMWGAPAARLQLRTGIPAAWVLAQFVHEGLTPENYLSTLAAQFHNWAGLKWADWMRPGGQPVAMPTNEWDGTRLVVTQTNFAAFPDTGQFLACYESLLTGSRYRPALQFAGDPLLYGYMVWRLGWATDPVYLIGVANRMIEFDTLATAKEVLTRVQADGG